MNNETNYRYMDCDTIEKVRERILSNVDKEINAKEYFLRKKINTWTLEYQDIDSDNMQLFTITKVEEDKFDIKEERLIVEQGNHILDIFETIEESVDEDMSIHRDQIDDELGYLNVYFPDIELTLVHEIKWLRDKDYSINTKEIKKTFQAK